MCYNHVTILLYHDVTDCCIDNAMYARVTPLMPPLYENAYKMDNPGPIYEELPLTFLPARNKIKVKDCPAYGINVMITSK